MFPIYFVISAINQIAHPEDFRVFVKQTQTFALFTEVWNTKGSPR